MQSRNIFDNSKDISFEKAYIIRTALNFSKEMVKVDGKSGKAEHFVVDDNTFSIFMRETLQVGMVK